MWYCIASCYTSFIPQRLNNLILHCSIISITQIAEIFQNTMQGSLNKSNTDEGYQFRFINWLIVNLYYQLIDWLMDWCFTPTFAVFQYIVVDLSMMHCFVSILATYITYLVLMNLYKYWWYSISKCQSQYSNEYIFSHYLSLSLFVYIYR